MDTVDLSPSLLPSFPLFPLSFSKPPVFIHRHHQPLQTSKSSLLPPPHCLPSSSRHNSALTSSLDGCGWLLLPERGGGSRGREGLLMPPTEAAQTLSHSRYFPLPPPFERALSSLPLPGKAPSLLLSPSPPLALSAPYDETGERGARRKERQTERVTAASVGEDGGREGKKEGACNSLTSSPSLSPPHRYSFAAPTRRERERERVREKAIHEHEPSRVESS